MTIRFGCQTYTWQMSGERYLGELDRIIGVAGDAGFSGLECEIQFLGKLRDPALMQKALDDAGIDFAALSIVSDWAENRETDAEKAETDFAIDYLATSFPDAILNIVPFAGPNRDNLAERQDNHLAIINDIARRAADRGLKATYHPNSVPGSTCITRDDYRKMLDGLDTTIVGWCPDIYHIKAGGMQPLELLRDYRELVGHVHYSDFDAQITPQAMGQGVMDYEAVTSYLAETGYDGWLVVEDHCEWAKSEPDEVTRSNGRYFREKLAPLIGSGRQ
ncbi:sugar phosphate isomerase/epimerase family protein [Pseudohoeflea coraliihabitans]|uniref:Sugar phosphate isomerase/epimerase n=1 Tax=Pseudohoeflea coraliihabitans TaxID=2860393 RepID=A0ABS6WLJ0_9HYPH|nr:sugar phosphate isomerase/epimerase [Pseudohoeflea sp. DP4N28-3]MBW3096000.1 sugar phosphate isomerase/epimerase [Pseudohoeflea sp. DP4N28-3]